MNKINLNNLELKTFTEQDALDYCQLNSINPEDITELYLNDNELTDISGVKLFKNLKELYLNYNKLKNILVLKDLNKLERLNLNNNKITDILILKNLNKLETLYLSYNELTDISVIQYLNNLIILGIRNLRLESDQIQYIKSIKKLEKIWCENGFKDMNILNQLNSNIKSVKQ